MKRTISAALALVVFAGLFGVQPIESYAYGDWHTKYVWASSKECAEIAEVRRRYKRLHPDHYVTPLAACSKRIRWRQATVNNWAGAWSDRWVQLNSAAPGWPSGYSMTLEVRVHYNGTRAKYEPATLRCWHSAFLVTLKETECKVFGDGTAEVTPRMQYTVGMGFLFANFEVGHGAQVTVSKTGAKYGLKGW